jgi:hypothetical protein
MLLDNNSYNHAVDSSKVSTPTEFQQTQAGYSAKAYVSFSARLICSISLLPTFSFEIGKSPWEGLERPYNNYTF